MKLSPLSFLVLILLFHVSCNKEEVENSCQGPQTPVSIEYDQLNELRIGNVDYREEIRINSSVIKDNGDIILSAASYDPDNWGSYLIMANSKQGLVCGQKLDTEYRPHFVIDRNAEGEIFTSYGFNYGGKTLRKYAGLDCKTNWDFEYESIVRDSWTIHEHVSIGMPYKHGNEILVTGVLEYPNNNYNTWFLRLNENKQVIEKTIFENSLLGFWALDDRVHMVGQKEIPNSIDNRLYIIEIDPGNFDILKSKEMSIKNNYGVHKLISNDYGYFFSVGWPRSNHISFSRYDYEGKWIYTQKGLVLQSSEGSQNVFDSGKGGILTVGALKDSTEFLVHEIGGWSGIIQNKWIYNGLQAKIMSIDNARILPNGDLVILCTYSDGKHRKIGFFKTKL